MRTGTRVVLLAAGIAFSCMVLFAITRELRFFWFGWSVWLGWLVSQEVREWTSWRRDRRLDDEYDRYPPGTRRRAAALARYRERCLEKATLEAEHRLRRDRVAMELLRSHLTEEQNLCLREKGYFFVPSQGIPGRNYKVSQQWSQNVELDTGDGRIEYCVVPADGGHWWPLGDILLAQLLLLRHDEETFLRKAYKTVIELTPEWRGHGT